MKRGIYSPPEAFSLSPLLALLPTKGQVGKLEALTASFFARYERVTGLLEELGTSGQPESRKRLLAEQSMLRQVLDWLEVKPEGGR